MDKSGYNPTTHIFLWDLHDVIMEKTLWSWFVTCIKFPRKFEIIRNLDKRTLVILFIFIAERCKLTKKQMVSEELIDAAQKAGNTALIDLTRDICSAYSPIKQTVAIINALTQKGYHHYLGSNIGQTVFDDCTKKFPTIFNLFEGNIIPFESPIHNTLIKKPYKEFFYAFLEKYNMKAENVIFIDDRLINVQSAQSIGMHAIHFKNPKDLNENLKNFIY